MTQLIKELILSVGRPSYLLLVVRASTYERGKVSYGALHVVDLSLAGAAAGRPWPKKDTTSKIRISFFFL